MSQPDLSARYRLRRVVNAVNGSTLAGLCVAKLGRADLRAGADGLVIASGYRLPVPPAPAFCIGNVIVTRLDSFQDRSPLLRHEARHATQFAWCGGVLMLPMYFLAAGCSWLAAGDFGSRNVFEQRAGLADGGYASKPLRTVLRRLGRTRAGTRRT